MVNALDDRYKIPEIVDTLRQAKPGSEMDLLTDLLLQQWRLFDKVFGVKKERYFRIGPRKPERFDIEPGKSADE